MLVFRSRHPSGNFLETRHVIDRVSGDFWRELRFVDADGEPVTLPPDAVNWSAFGNSPPLADCQAAERKF